MAKAYSYLRFSSTDQATGDSFRRQIALTESYAKEHGLDLDTGLTLHDLGVSAFRGANLKDGALGQFLSAIKEGTIEPGSYLLIESLDRFSRADLMTVLPVFIEVIKAGIIVVTLADEQEHSLQSINNNQFQLFSSILVMIRAHEESQRKSERVAAAWKQKRIRARESNEGMTAACPEWLRLNKAIREYEVIPERVAVIQRIYERSLEGYGRIAIAKELNRLNIPAFKSKKGWQDSYVTKVLKNRAVIGEYQPHKMVVSESGTKRREPDGEPIKDYFPSIVSEDIFNKSQYLHATRRNPSGPRSNQFSNLFQGLVYCACGSSMHYVNKGKPPKGYNYLVCAGARRGAGCVNSAWRYDHLEPNLLLGLFRHVDFQALTYDSTTKQTSRLATLREELSGIEAQLHVMSQQLGNVVNAIADIGSSQALKTKLHDLETSIASLTATQEQLQKEESRIMQSLDNKQDELLALYTAGMEVMTTLRMGSPEQVRNSRIKLNGLLRSTVNSIRFDSTQGIVTIIIGDTEVYSAKKAGLTDQATTINELIKIAIRLKLRAATNLVI